MYVCMYVYSMESFYAFYASMYVYRYNCKEYPCVCMYVRRHVSDLGGALCGHVRPAVDQRPVGRTRHRRVNLLAIRSVWGPLVDPG